MKLVHIFGPDSSEEEGVWALKYEKGAKDELTAIFEMWQDPEYMDQFCVENLALIQAAFGKPIGATQAADILMDEADELYELLVDLAQRDFPGPNLQELFKPLENSDAGLTVLQLSKGSIKNQHIRNPKLRIYAIRIAGNAFVITGGAIKLTHRMEQALQTSKQLQRLSGVRDWLKNQGICYPEDLNQLL